MRVAMTRLRTTIALFSPMVDGDEQLRLGAELKVAERPSRHRPRSRCRARAAGENQGQDGDVIDRSWKQERAACQRHLTRALGSPALSAADCAISPHGSRTATGRGSGRRKPSSCARSRRIDYCSDTLKTWRAKLLKKSRKLKEFGARKRHRVRLANKRLSYAIEAAAELAPSGETPPRLAMLKLLRKAQKSLGQLERRRAFSRARGHTRRKQDRRKRSRVQRQTKKTPAAKGNQRLSRPGGA